ncbi:MAG: fumarylacetoacetate hydrolase family protein, partial [Alphaproteobacteria bacterium]|nr:fumarylacetoacetate hydrolase family protein [Alphaproteobacteria bacterium]
MSFIFPPHEIAALSIHNTDQKFPVRRIYCVGRNYAEHAREMGHDPNREPPFFFQKSAENIYQGEQFPYPAKSDEVH